MRRLLIPILGAVACGPAIQLPEQGTSGDASTDGASEGGVLDTGGPNPGTTTPPSATSGGAPTDTAGPTTLDDSGGMDSSNFIDFETGGTCAAELPPGTLAHCTWCDVFAQNCPDGEKCMPWANDGGPAWNATRCSPLHSDPQQAGEPCHVEGSGVSGIDDCDTGLICFHVDPDTLEGECASMCTGSSDNPICPEGSQCAISGDGALNLCVDNCDPLDDACAFGTCVPYGEGFACYPVPADTPVGEPCEFIGQCVSGATCLETAATGPCADGFSCCTSFCDLTAADPDAQCLAGQTCESWYEGETAPADLTHVGVCLQSPP